MKLFLDRNKTLLPRIDFIYLLTRIMTVAGMLWVIFGHEAEAESITLMHSTLGLFVIHLVIFALAIKDKFDIKLAYLSAILFDLFLIPVLILHTGGVTSSFFLLFYLTVSVATYTLSVWAASTITVIVTIAYLATIYQGLTPDSMFNVTLRTGFMWVYFLALVYASQYIRKSERRLLKLFDTLNMRTSELEKSQAQLEMIYENTRTLAAILDSDGVLKEVMKIMGKVLQYASFSIILRDKLGNYFYRSRSIDGELFHHPKAIESTNMSLIQKVYDHGEPITVKDIQNRDDYQPLSENSKSIIIVPLVSHGRINGILAAESNRKDFFKDRDLQLLSVVARSAGMALENAELHRRTEELTMTDELTGIFNYRYFVHKLQEEKRRSLRYELPLSIIMVDIDWFKKLNDNFGHETGNKVLSRLAEIIIGCIRDVDVFCRYGGEEFAVILPQTALSEASVIGERIREQVEAEMFRGIHNEQLKSTVSVGISSFPENGKSHEELVSVADQALYRAKGEGRNMVCSI